MRDRVRGGVIINTGMSTSELVEVADGYYDITILPDGSITCAAINSAFANGETVTFKFTEGDLVLEQSDVETASAGYAALSTSGNRKIGSLFGLSGVSNVEIYLDDTAQSVDIVITI